MPEIVKIPGTNINIVKDFYDKLFESLNTDVMVVVKPETEIKEDRELTHYINVNNIEIAISKIIELGGEIKVEKTGVPRMGYFIEAIDPEGHYFGLWEENSSAEM